MLSRVADNIYWMSRYLERAEHTARLLRVRHDTLIEESEAAAERSWARLVAALAGRSPPIEDPSGADITRFLAFDPANRSSMIGSIRSARDNARQARELISSGFWEALNRQYLDLMRVDFDAFWAGNLGASFNQIVDGLLLLRAIAHSTMHHGEGWRFLELGRYIERASLLCRLADVYYSSGRSDMAEDPGVRYFDWITLLKQCAAFEAYCKIHTARIDPARVAELLVFDPEFPHSVRFAANEVQRALASVGEGASSARRANVERLAGRLAADLAYARADELGPSRIAPFVRETERHLESIHAAIYEAFVAYGVDAAMTG